MSDSDLKVVDVPPSPTEVPTARTAGPTDAATGVVTRAPVPGWLSSITQVLVVASIAAYGAGFVVAVPHYLRGTVPIRALAHDVFLGAGILFWILTGAALAVGKAIAKAARESPPPASRWGKFWWFWATAGFPVTLALTVGGLRGAAYMATVGLLLSWTPHNLTALRLTEFSAFLVSEASRRTYTLIGTMVAFSYFVFPYVVPAYGGGQEQDLASVTLPSASPIGSQDAWLKFSCRQFPTPASTASPICRRFYRVYESTESLYLGIAEWPGPCAPKGGSPRFADSDRRCVQRIANSSLPQFEVTEHL